MILIAGQASAVFTLTNVAVVPEVFGRSRWIKALLLTTVLGTLASLTIKGTVIASWKQNDPATWNLPFQMAAVILVAVGIAVLVLVREAPNASFGAEADRKQRARPTRDELRDILAGPNAKVLVGGSLLFWSGVGSTAYVAILFFQRVLHAGASAQTIAGLATGLPVFFIGIGLGDPPQPEALPHAAGRRGPADRRRPGRSAVLRHPPLAGGGPQLHRGPVHRRLHHRDGPPAPPAPAHGPAAWASDSGCCWPRSTCAA